MCEDRIEISMHGAEDMDRNQLSALEAMCRAVIGMAKDGSLSADEANTGMVQNTKGLEMRKSMGNAEGTVFLITSDQLEVLADGILEYAVDYGEEIYDLDYRLQHEFVVLKDAELDVVRNAVLICVFNHAGAGGQWHTLHEAQNKVPEWLWQLAVKLDPWPNGISKLSFGII